MKQIKFLLAAMVFTICGMPVFSQTYKTLADTAALNKEYLQVSSDIAGLNVKLNTAQSDLGKYTEKSNDATSDAQNSANSTTDKASNATNGSVKDARKAKRQAKRSVHDAKDARKAGNNLDDHNEKLRDMNQELVRKQNRLNELDAMRAAINPSQQ